MQIKSWTGICGVIRRNKLRIYQPRLREGIKKKLELEWIQRYWDG